jgi:ubiquinone/menaquinone biosynthesis C-methylase UbiE
MKETSKAMRRRFIEDRTGVIPWWKWFRGNGIDIGCGPDKVPFDDCIGFDKEHGDANELTFADNSFSYVHSSQSLEHMRDPATALRNWIGVTKPKGRIIVTVPDFVLYEGLVWPSRYNPDHKSTWSMWLPDSPAPIHCYLPQWLEQFDNTKLLLCRVVDTNYDYKILTKKDQTLPEDKGVEAFIEFVLQKK